MQSVWCVCVVQWLMFIQQHCFQQSLYLCWNVSRNKKILVSLLLPKWYALSTRLGMSPLIPALYIELGNSPMQNTTHLHRQASYQPQFPHLPTSTRFGDVKSTDRLITFGAKVSLPLTQSAPAITRDTTRLCWIVVTLWDCHINADAVRALSWIFFFMYFLLSDGESQECGGWVGN